MLIKLSSTQYEYDPAGMMAKPVAIIYFAIVVIFKLCMHFWGKIAKQYSSLAG